MSSNLKMSVIKR